jgi:hypothetical protein
VACATLEGIRGYSPCDTTIDDAGWLIASTDVRRIAGFEAPRTVCSGPADPVAGWQPWQIHPTS